MVRRRSHAPLPCQGAILRGEIGSEFAELARRGGRPTCGRVLGGRLQLGGDSSVGAVRGERQMAGALLGVRHHLRERAMHGPSLPDRRLLITDRGEQGMREANGESSSSTTPSSAQRLECLR